ncbi:hypothetical protein DTQ70_23850 [Runella sp. SP2]|nr:hypothetical protein DTQ70_23850 [Runella sp. SP2]
MYHLRLRCIKIKSPLFDEQRAFFGKKVSIVLSVHLGKEERHHQLVFFTFGFMSQKYNRVFKNQIFILRGVENPYFFL